jgi:hypothetical protein
VYTLETATAGAGVASFKKYFPNEYHEFCEPHFEHVQTSAKETVGFNQFDKDNASTIAGGYISNGKIQSATGRGAVYIPCFPNTTYCASRKAAEANERFAIAYAKELPADGVDVYGTTSAPSSQTIGNTMAITTTTGADAKYIVVWAYWDSHTEALDTLCVNISGDRDGEYEPYRKRTYPLDSSLTLRGIPKLDSANRLYFDGDIYEHDGTVMRRYGIVDLGTLTWTTGTDAIGQYFKVNSAPSDMAHPTNSTDIAKAICTKYALSNSGNVFDGSIAVGWTPAQSMTVPIYCRDTTCETLSAFQTKISGTMMVYELKEPTTETAEPFQSPMVVDPLGTEAFIDAGVEEGTRDVSIPVGHTSEYPADLRGKLQHLPSLSTSGDGRYVVVQTGNQMTLSPDTSLGLIAALEARVAALEGGNG